MGVVIRNKVHYGDELYDRKRPQEVNPLLTHNASLTFRMYAHGRRQLPAFDFLAHLLLGLDNNVTQKLIDSQKQSSELTVDITIVHLVTGTFCTLTVSAPQTCK